VGEGDQVREDQTGVRRGITVPQSLLSRADEVRDSANGTSSRSAVAHHHVSKRSRTGHAPLFRACCQRRF
jgi:hypothetical protein